MNKGRCGKHEEKTREARLIWLGHMERKTEEDVVMTTWKTEVIGHRKIGRPKLRCQKWDNSY